MIRGGEIVYMDIPHIGLFVCKNNVAGVQFHDFLISDTKVGIFSCMSFENSVDDSEQELGTAEEDQQFPAHEEQPPYPDALPVLRPTIGLLSEAPAIV